MLRKIKCCFPLARKGSMSYDALGEMQKAQIKTYCVTIKYKLAPGIN